MMMKIVMTMVMVMIKMHSKGYFCVCCNCGLTGRWFPWKSYEVIMYDRRVAFMEITG